MSDEYKHVPLKFKETRELHPKGTAERIAALEAQLTLHNETLVWFLMHFREGFIDWPPHLKDIGDEACRTATNRRFEKRT